MIHSIDPGILFWQEEDVIKAGVLDMKMTLAAVEKTYKMLGEGQIINPPKTHIGMPIGSGENWQSFFNSMPCYIGGDVNVGGTKWAAESKKNSSIPGIPYGIDITVLSDPETVLPVPPVLLAGDRSMAQWLCRCARGEGSALCFRVETPGA